MFFLYCGNKASLMEQYFDSHSGTNSSPGCRQHSEQPCLSHTYFPFLKHANLLSVLNLLFLCLECSCQITLLQSPSPQNPKTLSWVQRDLLLGCQDPSCLAPMCYPSLSSPLQLLKNRPLLQSSSHETFQVSEGTGHPAFTLEWGKASESPWSMEGPVQSFSNFLNSQLSHFMCLVNYVHANKSVISIHIQPVCQLSSRDLKKNHN